MNTVDMAKRKFATQIDDQVLDELRAYASASGRRIGSVVSEAVAEYLGRVQVRPAFREAADEVIGDNEELLRRLAR
jgi:hypothetical protein